MNFRAQLYDAWRQLRVTANALKGVLNISVTNQYLTPPTTNNPFAFLDQAKQFSLVLNAELPLIRINERNQFRQALINYQRQRRMLQYQEDYQKIQLRGDVRNLQVAYLSYQLAKRNFVLLARQKDQAFENIVAPPQGGGGGAAGGGATGAGNAGTNASAAVQTHESDPGPERPDQPRNVARHPVVRLPAAPPHPLPRPRHLALRRMGGLL